MKSLLTSLMLASLALVNATTVHADATPVVDARQDNQEARIDQGVRSGELTAREAARLDAQQDRIERREARAKADGDVTAAERVRLHRAENRASRNIARQKHDRQDRD